MPRGGKRPGSGRKKGGTNKITADVREAIMELSGAEYLRKVATEDPKAFCALLGKLIPVKVAGDAESPLVLGIDRPPDETREQWLERTARERGITHTPAILSPATRPTNGGDDS